MKPNSKFISLFSYTRFLRGRTAHRHTRIWILGVIGHVIEVVDLLLVEVLVVEIILVVLVDVDLVELEGVR